ncbi:MAG TPA: hypothetical protein VMA97_03485 [Streptosporangiaceae bacterium]|nr:hypothetical protein [Streptosporangiaceae bacterium]
MVLVLDAAIAITGAFLAHGSGLLGLLAAGPLLACARCGGRATALVAAYAIALCAIAAAIAGVANTDLASYRFIMVIVSGVVAVFVSVIRGRRESHLIRINDRVQRAILRPLPAEFGGVAFAAHYQSATKQALVGGDLYDIAMTQYGPRFIIGDVKGKGWTRWTGAPRCWPCSASWPSPRPTWSAWPPKWTRACRETWRSRTSSR